MLSNKTKTEVETFQLGASVSFNVRLGPCVGHTFSSSFSHIFCLFCNFNRSWNVLLFKVGLFCPPRKQFKFRRGIQFAPCLTPRSKEYYSSQTADKVIGLVCSMQGLSYFLGHTKTRYLSC